MFMCAILYSELFANYHIETNILLFNMKVFMTQNKDLNTRLQHDKWKNCPRQ
jgi:hypothetical protein